jgi:hypothetical protein
MKTWKLPSECKNTLSCFKLELCETCKAALREYEKNKKIRKKSVDKH